MMEHVIVDYDNVMQCDWMPLRDPRGPVLESPQNFPEVLGNG